MSLNKMIEEATAEPLGEAMTYTRADSLKPINKQHITLKSV